MAPVFITILSLYCLVLVVMLYGWLRIRRQPMPVSSTQVPGISVIVAMRNEEGNIPALLQSLSTLAYAPDKYEVILVNDHSADNTWVLTETLIGKFPNMRLIELPPGKEGKKEALALGILSARFEIIATTDADCRFSKNWLQCMSFYFEDPKSKMVSGAVKLTTDDSFLSRLQSTEFNSLVGSGAAAIGLGHPVMCNGANLAFRKDVFNEVEGYTDNMHIASGDDEFLMRKIFKRYPDGIRFLNQYEGVVSSHPQKTLKNFFQQRLRWAGKWRYNADRLSKALAVFIFLAQISFAGLLLINLERVDGSLAILMTKAFLEGILLAWIGRFLDRRFDWLAFLSWQFIYPIYVTVIGLASLVSGYEWKTRNYR